MSMRWGRGGVISTRTSPLPQTLSMPLILKFSPGIGRRCPNLINLAFSNIPVFDLPQQLGSEWFKKMEAVELWSMNNAQYSPALIKQLLLFSPILRNILFNSCNVLTDELFLEIMLVGRFCSSKTYLKYS